MSWKFWTKQENLDEFQLEEPSDIFLILEELKKRNHSEKLRFVVNELCSNIFENNERAKIIFKEKIVHLMIYQDSLDEDKKNRIEKAIEMAKELRMKVGAIKFNNEKYGGLGMKMIHGAGYELDYKDNKDYFSIVAYQNI